MAELWWSCPSCGLLSEPCSHTGSTRPLCVDCGMIGPACTCKTEPPRELTRDLLLSEIRRSLMATHPDRAEALCAALERRIPKEEPPDGGAHPGWLMRTVQDGRTVYRFRDGGIDLSFESGGFGIPPGLYTGTVSGSDPD